MDQNEMSNLYRGPSIDASYQVSYRLKAVSEEELFQKQTNQRTFHRCFLPRVSQSIWPSCFRVEDFQKSTNQKQELSVVAMFIAGSGQNEQSSQRTFNRCFLPSFGSFGQAVSEKIFRNRPIRNKNCLWWPCLLTDQNVMSKSYRGHSIDASYQVSVHLAKRFQRRRFFRNQPIRNKNCLWRPCLLMERDEMNNCNRGLSIDASYQVPVHLAKRFQRRRI